MANSTNNSSNLSKGDVVSFIAILLLGVLVFFGVNFWSLGDKVQSVVIAVVLVILLTLSVFLAGFAKGQNRNQGTWKGIELGMIVAYILIFIPAALFTSKFCAIQFNKTEIINQAQGDLDDINKMFSEYDNLCKSRSNSVKTTLKSLALDKIGREKIASTLGINEKNINDNTIEQAGESFLNKLRGTEYGNLKTDRTALENNVMNNFRNWNIILVPQYASELGTQKEKFATSLEKIYNNNKSEFETNVPEFKINSSSTSKDNITKRFHSLDDFSIVGLVIALILGILGFSKYLLSAKRTVIDFKKGDTSVISEDGGFAF